MHIGLKKSLSEIPVKVLNNEELTERYPDINFITMTIASMEQISSVWTATSIISAIRALR